MMLFLLGSALLSPPSLWGSFAEAAAADNAGIEMYDSLTGFQQCSHGDKEWYICRGNYQPLQYCPSVLEFNSSHVPELMRPCFTCPDAKSDCETVVSDVLEKNSISEEASYDDDYGYNIADELISSCQRYCEAGKKGDACWSNSYTVEYDTYRDSCTPGSYFCDFASDKDFAMNILGTCKACPSDQDDCYQDGFATSSEGKQNCAGCRLDCWDKGKSILTVNGKEIPSLLIQPASQKSYQNVSGHLVDCSNLVLESEYVCQGADGHICIVDYTILRESEVAEEEWKLSNAAKRNGCVAIIALTVDFFYWNYVEELAIPFIRVNRATKDERKQLLNNEDNVMVQVELQVFGSLCSSITLDCNVNVPCSESKFCDYIDIIVDDEYTEGICTPCPMSDTGEPYPAGCFFDQIGMNTYSGSSPKAVQSCAKACNATLVSDQCKFCPSEISALEFGVEDKADQCYFCPNNDIQYPEKIVPLFGENVTCWMIQTFFNRMEVHKDSPNCRLVQSMNYMCGCDGTGYAGANTHTKQVVLVWLPRVSAILSMAGSLFIIFDTLRTCQKRAKLMNQLLSTLSLFDIMGSISYSLTTLPTPASDELYGSKGNEESCTAQGFFIQIGTIACFLNVSLAVYYLLTIKYGWTEARLKRKRARYFLFIPPITVGLAYAFVGIPFYDNVRVWCNNSAKWWPEVPVILAIIAATGVMGALCYYVYKIEHRTTQFTNNGLRHSMVLFKQSCWFVFGFYITWIPYLALQYMLSSGKAYANYGLILSASTLVPLQGFWNNFVYIRPRYLRRILAHFGSSLHLVSSVFKRNTEPNSTQPSASASEALHQAGAHDQLQEVQVQKNAVMNVLDEDGKKANTANKIDLDGITLDTAPKDKIGPKSDEDIGQCLAAISDQYGNVMHLSEGNGNSDKPLRVSDHESGIDKTKQKQKQRDKAKGISNTQDFTCVEDYDGYKAFLTFLQT